MWKRILLNIMGIRGRGTGGLYYIGSRIVLSFTGKSRRFARDQDRDECCRYREVFFLDFLLPLSSLPLWSFFLRVPKLVGQTWGQTPSPTGGGRSSHPAFLVQTPLQFKASFTSVNVERGSLWLYLSAIDVS